MHKSENKFDRRRFLGTIAMAGAAIPFANIDRKSYLFSSPASPRLIHVFSKPLQWLDYDSLAAVLAESGAEGIDLSVRPGGHVLPEKVETDLPKAVEAAHRHGLKIEMIVTAIIDADEKYSETILKTASGLGIKYYRLGYFNYDETIGVWSTLQKIKPGLYKLAGMNSKCNIHGAYQNHVGTRIGAPVWDLYELFKDLDPDYIGCQYDIRHAVVEGSGCWSNGLKLLTPWIKCTDIKDFKWNIINGKWTPESVPIGEGMVNYDEYFKLVKRFNIPGPVSVHFEYPPFERFTKELPDGEKRKLFVEAMKKDIDVVKSYLLKYQL